MARLKYVLKIMQKGNNIVYHLDRDNFDSEVVTKLISKYKNRVKFSSSNIPYLTFSLGSGKVLEEVKKFLEVL